MAEFDDEVDEALRRARLKAAWDRYGNYGIGAVVFILVMVASWSIYDTIVSTERDQFGEVLLRGDGAERSEQTDNAVAAYNYLRENAKGSGYDLIAAFREAALLGQSGKSAEQQAIYDGILEQEDLAEHWKEAASFYKVWSQIEALEPEALKAQLQPFLVESNPYYPNALEAMVLSYMIAEKRDEALGYARKLFDYSEVEGQGGGLFDYVGLIEGGEPVELDRATIEKMEQDKREVREARIKAQEQRREAQSQAQRLVNERLFRDIDLASVNLYYTARVSHPDETGASNGSLGE